MEAEVIHDCDNEACMAEIDSLEAEMVCQMVKPEKKMLQNM